MDRIVSLNNDTFKGFKDDFDEMVNQTLTTMQEKGTDEATVSMKMAVRLVHTTVKDDMGFPKKVVIPSFHYGFNSAMQIKDKRSGCLADDCEMVYDKKEGKYVLKALTDGQYRFDKDGNIMDGYGDPVEAEKEAEKDTILASVDKSKNTDSIMTSYDWLKRFAGEKLMMSENMGNISLRVVETGKLVFSTAMAKDSFLHLENTEMVRDNIGEELECRVIEEEKIAAVTTAEGMVVVVFEG